MSIAIPHIVLQEPLLTGKAIGIVYRKWHKLDELDNIDEPVVVEINSKIVTSSFIHGMFYSSIKRFGADFYKKYGFITAKDILDNIDINVRYIIQGLVAE